MNFYDMLTVEDVLGVINNRKDCINKLKKKIGKIHGKRFNGPTTTTNLEK